MSNRFDYIIVGAGAGGGPLACNLALAPEGFRVALLEAGTDPTVPPSTQSFYDYSVPALHARASEDPHMSWAFFVQHYTDPDLQKKDSKLNVEQGGIFYPRAAAVGGCTAHHAMITIYPHNSDWEKLRCTTGDPSWSADNMRGYFERLEECRYLPPLEPGQARDPLTRHGLTGWLPVSMPDPTLALNDPQLLRILFKAFLVAYLDREHKEVFSLLVDEKRGSQPDERRKQVAALQQGVTHLVARAHDPRNHFPESLRTTLTALASAASARDHQAASPRELLDRVADDPDLLALFRMTQARLDPNRWFEKDAERTGVFNTPASIVHGTRSSVRERILAVRSLYPDRLVLIPAALATEVLIENGQAVGVRYASGAHLYRASPLAGRGNLPETKELRLREGGEVILSCGTFNTPQLLMLSGVGPEVELTKAGVKKVHCNLPGVGKHLHDRYEITLVSELPDSFRVLEGSKFEPPPDPLPPDWDDPALREWMSHRGVYATNGVVLSIIKRSRQAEDDVPDLFLFGVPGNFRGYRVGYSKDVQSEEVGGKHVVNHRRFTWAILKGRTRNRAGEVLLATTDPRDRPKINLKHFQEGSPGWEKDRDALVEGLQLAGQIMKATGLKPKTLFPDVNVEDRDKLRDFVLREAWGHHACGTCKIGSDEDKAAVLDGDFRVRGVENLRVVDASVFPDIPGFFIVTSVYMISEKASDVLLRDRRQGQRRPWPKPARQ